MTPPETSDHDLLIEMRAVLQQAVKSIDELKSGTHAQLQDHEGRLRMIENDYIKSTVYFTNHTDLADKLDALQRLVWIGLGVAITATTIIQLIPRFLK